MPEDLHSIIHHSLQTIPSQSYKCEEGDGRTAIRWTPVVDVTEQENVVWFQEGAAKRSDTFYLLVSMKRSHSPFKYCVRKINIRCDESSTKQHRPFFSFLKRQESP